MNSKRKYILKPGKHQFAPKSPAIHDNENLTDEQAQWYLEKYPHIKTLFVQSSEVQTPEIKEFPIAFNEQSSNAGLLTESIIQ